MTDFHGLDPNSMEIREEENLLHALLCEAFSSSLDVECVARDFVAHLRRSIMGSMVMQDLLDLPSDKVGSLPTGEASAFLIEEFEQFLALLDS